MNLKGTDTEIKRIKEAMNKSKSDKLKSDYGKHLRKLERTMAGYERSYRQAAKW